MANVDAIKTIREKTQAPIGAIRKALEESGGDEGKALALLRERGASVALKRAGHAASEGRVEAYIHHDGKTGVLVEVNCETDFVARTEDFKQFCRDLAMHVAARQPQYLDTDHVPAGAAAASGMTEQQFIQEACLLEQAYIKDQAQTIAQCVEALTAKTGERVAVRRFVRFRVGEAPLSGIHAEHVQ